MENNMNSEPEESTETWFKYAKTYDPIKCASIDGTDSMPHDRAVLRALNSDYNPNRFVKGRPESTIFISRLNHETSKETMKDIFSKYGKLRRFRLVKDIVTGMPKGYAFVEYEEEQGAEEAYRLANRMVVDGNAIFVDFECERLLKGWKPRRLGGGFAGKKESGQLRFGGRDRPFKKPIALELKEQEERRQKERRNRADDRRRRDNSRERNRRKSPRENGFSLPKEPKKTDSTPKYQTKRPHSPKEEANESSPEGQKPLSRKRRHSTEKSSYDTARKPEASPLNKPASAKDDNKPSLSKKRHVSPKSPSRERSRHRSRERRKNRSNERRRSPLADFGRPRSPVERNRKRNSPKRTKRRTSRSPKRSARKRSPRQNDKDPAIVRDRLRRRSPLRKQDEELLPLGGERRSRHTKQESLERQVNYSRQDRDRLTTEPNRYSQPSPHRMNERFPHFGQSPASPRQGSRERSPGRKLAREDYSAEKSNRRLADNAEYAVSRSRSAISPKHAYSRRSPPEDPRLKHPAYQDLWPQQEPHYNPGYPEDIKNGKEFNYTPHLGESYPSYGNYLVSSQQFSSVESSREPGRVSVQALEQPSKPPGRSVCHPMYDQPPSRDPRLNVTQYTAQFLPQQPVIAQYNYGQMGEYYQVKRTEQVDIGSKQLHSATSAGDPMTVSREFAKHPNKEERYVRGRTRP